MAPGMVLWLLAFGITVTVVLRTRLRQRPVAAIILAPLLWLVLVFSIGIVAVNLGLVAP